MSVDPARARVQNHKFFGALESLRGIACLLVVLYHIPPWYGPFARLGVVHSGHLAVEFFFVLSGFVLFHSYGSRITDFATLKRFMILRLFRLYPVHFAFMLLFFGFELAKYVSATRHGLLAPAPMRELLTALGENTLLVQGVGLRKRSVFLNFPSWSISTEFYTYLIFGLVSLSVPPRRFAQFALGITLVSLAVLTAFHGDSEFQQLLRCVGGFFLGCLVHIAFSRMSGDEAKHDWALPMLLAVAVAISVDWHGPSKLWELSFGFSALLILALVKKPSGATSRALEWAPFRLLGLISYSLYMSHALALRLVSRVLDRLFPLVVAPGVDRFAQPLASIVYISTLVAVIGIGSLTYLVLERPFKRLAARVSRATR